MVTVLSVGQRVGNQPVRPFVIGGVRRFDIDHALLRLDAEKGTDLGYDVFESIAPGRRVGEIFGDAGRIFGVKVGFKRKLGKLCQLSVFNPEYVGRGASSR